MRQIGLKVLALLMILSSPLRHAAQDIIFKMNLLPIAVSSYSPSVEFPLSRTFSASLGVGVVKPGAIHHMNLRDLGGGQTITLDFDGFNATAEVRCFPFGGKKAPYGPYIGGFFRYFNYALSTDYHFTNVSGEAKELKGNGSAEGYGFGGTLGYQLKIKKFLAVDVFAGYGQTSTKAEGFFNDDSYTLYDYWDLRETIAEGGKNFTGFKAYGEGFFGKFEFSGWRPMIRAGICIGFALRSKSVVPTNFD